MEPIYDWDAENRITTCTISDKRGNKYIGIAKCHPDDYDFGNSYTGSMIALERAYMNYLKSIKRNEIQPGLAALKQLYYSINQSQSYNPNSYESKMLWRQIRLKQEDLEFIEEELADREQNLKRILAEKEIFYQKIRKARAAKL